MAQGGSDRVLLVTGGSRGIGAAIARLAASRGYAVGVNYRSRRDAADAVVADITAAGGRAVALVTSTPRCTPAAASPTASIA